MGGGGGVTESHPVLARLTCRHPGRVLLKVTFLFHISSECGEGQTYWKAS